MTRSLNKRELHRLTLAVHNVYRVGRLVTCHQFNTRTCQLVQPHTAVRVTRNAATSTTAATAQIISSLDNEDEK